MTAPCLPRTNIVESTRTALNTFITSQIGTLYDGCANFNNLAMFQSGNAADFAYYGDGVHPNTRGHNAMAPAWVALVSPTITGGGSIKTGGGL